MRRLCTKSAAISPALATFEATLTDLRQRFEPLAKAIEKHAELDAAKKQALADASTELRDAATPYETGRTKLLAALDSFGKPHAKAVPVMVPDGKNIRLFDGSVAPMFRQVGSLLEQNQKLRTARDLLLPRLMSGKIAV